MPDEFETTQRVDLDADVIVDEMEDLADTTVDALGDIAVDAVDDRYEGFCEVVRTSDQRVIDEVTGEITRFRDSGGQVTPEGLTGGVVSVLRFDDDVKDFFGGFFENIEGVITQSNEDLGEAISKLENLRTPQRGSSGSRSRGRDSGTDFAQSVRLEDTDAYIQQFMDAAEEADVYITPDEMQEHLAEWSGQKQALDEQERIRKMVQQRLDHLAEINEAEQWAVETLGEDLKGEVALFRKQQADAEEQRDRREEYESRGDVRARGMATDITRSISSLSGELGKMRRDPLGGILDIGGSFASIIGNTTAGSALGNGAGLAGMLEGAGLGGIAEGLGTVGSVLSTAVPIIGGIAAAAGLFGTGMDVVQDAKDVALKQGLTGMDALTAAPGMGLQAMVTGYTSGLSQKEVEDIQSALVQNRAEWGSREYDQGFNFALDAAQNRGISGTQAVRYYTDMVVKGGESMATLNERMDALTETTQNTALGMDEVTKSVADMTNGFARMGSITGGNQLMSEGMAFDMADIFSNIEGGTGYEAKIAQGMASGIDFNNMVFGNVYSRYYQQTGNEAEAILLATSEISSGPYASALYAGQPAWQFALSPEGMTLYDYIGSRDWEGLDEALQWLKGVQMNPENGLMWGNVTAFFKSQFGMDDSISDDPEEIVRALRSIYEQSERVESGEAGVGATVDQIAFETPAGEMSEGESGFTTNGAGHINTDLGDWRRQDLTYESFLTNWLQEGERADLVNEVMRTKEGASIGTSLGGMRNQFDSSGVSVLKYLNDAGILSNEEWDSLTKSSASSLVTNINELYRSADTDLDFTEWLKGEGRSSLESAVSRATEMTTQAQEKRNQQVDVNITIGYEDGADRDLHARVERINRQDGMDEGLDG